MALILAVEPDERQAAILSGVVMNQLRADLVLVNSKDAAIARISRQVPDLILLTTLLSPRDEKEIVGQLRKMEDVEHLQTLTIPLLGSAAPEEEKGGGLLRAFRRKRAAAGPRGCDPMHFAKEIRTYLKRAAEIKAERRASLEAAMTATAVEMPAAKAKTVAVEAPAAKAKAASVPAPAPTPPAPSIDTTVLAPRCFASLMAAEERLARIRITFDAGDDTADDVAMMMRALRVPARVAAFAYPRGCRIDQVRLGKARPKRKPSYEALPRLRVTHSDSLEATR